MSATKRWRQNNTEKRKKKFSSSWISRVPQRSHPIDLHVDAFLASSFCATEVSRLALSAPLSLWLRRLELTKSIFKSVIVLTMMRGFRLTWEVGRRFEIKNESWWNVSLWTLTILLSSSTHHHLDSNTEIFKKILDSSSRMKVTKSIITSTLKNGNTKID